jgi:hypothetical protein
MLWYIYIPLAGAISMMIVSVPILDFTFFFTITVAIVADYLETKVKEGN